MKILVIRFSSLGDILLTTPVLRCLKLQRPDFSIHFVTKQEWAPLVERNPYVDKVHVLFRDFPSLVQELKAERFDGILDLHGSLRSRRLCFVMGKKAWRFNKQNVLKALIVHFKIKRSVRHVVWRYIEACQQWGVCYDGQGLDFLISEDEYNFSKGLLPEAFRPGFIAVTVGARHFTKTMPPEKLSVLLNTINRPVALLGGRAEAEVASGLLKQLRCPAVHLAGRLPLGMSAAILQQAAGVLAHDTGLMHMAAALRKPMVVLWGSTTPALGMYPLYPEGQQHLVGYSEVPGLPCRPCHKIGRSRCPRGHFACMQRQDPEAIRQLLEEKIRLSAP